MVTHGFPERPQAFNFDLRLTECMVLNTEMPLTEVEAIIELKEATVTLSLTQSECELWFGGLKAQTYSIKVWAGCKA